MNKNSGYTQHRRTESPIQAPAEGKVDPSLVGKEF